MLAVTLFGFSFEVRDALAVIGLVVVIVVAAWYAMRRRR